MEHDHNTLVRVVLAPLVIFSHDVGNVRTTDRPVGSAYHFDRKASEFFQCSLSRLTVFSNNIGIVATDFLFQVIQVNLVIKDATVTWYAQRSGWFAAV